MTDDEIDALAALRESVARIEARCRNVHISLFPSQKGRRKLNTMVRECHADAAASLGRLKFLEKPEPHRMWVRLQLRPILLRIDTATLPSDYAILSLSAAEQRLQACHKDAACALRLLDGMKACKDALKHSTAQEIEDLRSEIETLVPAHGHRLPDADQQAAIMTGEDDFGQLICRVVEEMDQLREEAMKSPMRAPDNAEVPTTEPAGASEATQLRAVENKPQVADCEGSRKTQSQKIMRVFVQYPHGSPEDVLPVDYVDLKAAVEVAKNLITTIKKNAYPPTYKVQVRHEPFGPEDYLWSDECTEMDQLGNS